MFSFIHHEVDVLLCTTNIESGIDIPSANCLIVSHAERFGLAQLYQIRGRVGRSSERAYCYLLTSREELSDIARKRVSRESEPYAQAAHLLPHSPIQIA